VRTRLIYLPHGSRPPRRAVPIGPCRAGGAAPHGGPGTRIILFGIRRSLEDELPLRGHAGVMGQSSSRGSTRRRRSGLCLSLTKLLADLRRRCWASGLPLAWSWPASVRSRSSGLSGPIELAPFNPTRIGPTAIERPASTTPTLRERRSCEGIEFVASPTTWEPAANRSGPRAACGNVPAVAGGRKRADAAPYTRLKHVDVLIALIAAGRGKFGHAPPAGTEAPASSHSVSEETPFPTRGCPLPSHPLLGRTSGAYQPSPRPVPAPTTDCPRAARTDRPAVPPRHTATRSQTWRGQDQITAATYSHGASPRTQRIPQIRLEVRPTRTPRTPGPATRTRTESGGSFGR